MILVIQNGYRCDYEMKLFAGLFFDESEDVVITQNFSYENNVINTYTEIIFKNNIYYEDYYFSFEADGKSQKLKKKIFTAACTKSLSHAALKITKINF